MVTWYAEVRAPEGGPIYVHNFEGNSPSDVLRYAADALDLSCADSVSIEITREDD